LFPHAAGCWAKKIRGKTHYFGPWSDPDAALAKYLEEKDALHAGRKPRESTDGLTVRELANAFLNAKQALLDTGELAAVTFAGYKRVCDEIVAAFGKQRLVADVMPDDFAALRNKLSKKWGPVRLGNSIQIVRSVFKHAYDSALMDRPMRFGPGFKRPTRKTIRLHKAAQGPKLFTRDEIRKLLDAANIPLRAMIYLAINCGLGNSDVGNLHTTALDLEGGMVNYPRPKTGIARRCPLWPETITALKAAQAARAKPAKPEHAGLVFLTRYGAPWHKGTSDAPITSEFASLLKRLGVNGRKGLGFYTLRHVFRTIADEARDQPAVDHMMGHASEHISSHYRETISDARLRAVSDYVHNWLFAPEPKPESPADGESHTLPMLQIA
jgi:integrase